MSSAVGSIDDDLLSAEAVADPYPVLAELRERAPVHYSEPMGGWILTRHEDVQRAFRDPDLSSDRIGPWYHGRLSPHKRQDFAPTYQVLSRWMVFNDPPEHTRLRGLVQRAFTPRMIANLRDRIREIVDKHLRDLPRGEPFDLVHQFAYPLPAIVIAEMLGVPPEDRDRFKSWSDQVTSLIFGALDDPERHERAQGALVALTAYFAELIDQRSGEPRDDLLGALVSAQEAGDALDLAEVTATCVLLLFGGHETTTNLIANGVRALLQHPEQWDLLRGSADTIPAAIEELLRFDGPVKAQIRAVSREVEIRGVTLGSRERVFLMQAAANRDPRQFDRPDSLDVTRNAGSHLGFGYGIHYCLGAPLARLESQMAFEGLLHAMPNLQLAGTEPEWEPVIITRALKRLDVVA